MEQQSIPQMLLSLQKEVQSLKFLNGGAISDLVSRVNRIENRYITYPNNNNITQLVNKQNTTTIDIVPDWNPTTNPYERVTVPGNGWVNVKTKCRNYNTAAEANSGTFTPRLIEVFIGTNMVTRAVAGITGLKYAIGACTDNMFPVRAGDVIKYGSEGVTPNGAYSEVVINFFPFVS